MSEQNDGLLAAILAVQGEAPTLSKNATNPHFKSKYTPLDTIVETIGPILHRHGLVWMALPGRDDRGEPALTYRLAHAPTGEVVEGQMPLLLSKNDAQGMGSAITYARRYALCAVLNLVADDDDDGARASRRASTGNLATDAQKKRLRTEVTRSNLNAAAMDGLFKRVEFERTEGEKVNDAINRLTASQASGLIDTISQGAIKTGGTDVPSSPDEFRHAPAGPDPVLA